MIKYFERLIEGLSIGAQKGFARSINHLFDIMENLDGAPYSGITLKRIGNQWRIHYDGSQGGSGSTSLSFPFQAYLTKSGSDDVVNCILGRVYEVNGLVSSSIPEDLTFAELTEAASAVPGDIVSHSLASITTDYLSIVVERGTAGELKRTYSAMLESAITTGYVAVKRIAKYTVVGGSGVLEQIHMGDVSFAENRIAPFSLATLGTAMVMYMPTNSIVINGKDFTSSQTGLTASAITDWYTVDSFASDGLDLYILMGEADGTAGDPLSVEFGTQTPSHPGEVITYRILHHTAYGLVNVMNSAICVDIVRFDGSSDSSEYLSIAHTTTNGKFSDENHTAGLVGFRGATAPTGDPLSACSTDGWTHHFAVREAGGQDGKVYLRWMNTEGLIEKIEDDILSDETFLCELYCLLCGIYVDGWIDWSWWWDYYGDFEANGCGFWKQGGSYCTNFGNTIGDGCKNETIDLDGRELLKRPSSGYGETHWSTDGDFTAANLRTGGGVYSDSVTAQSSIYTTTMNACTVNASMAMTFLGRTVSIGNVDGQDVLIVGP